MVNSAVPKLRPREAGPRRVIDARTQPVMITTLRTSDFLLSPLERATALVPSNIRKSELAHRETERLAPVAPRSSRRGAVVLASAVSGSLALVGTAGFALGFAGVGEALLLALAVAAAVALVAAALLTVAGGTTGVHCPGAWHR